jgi:transcriptional regulator with XRE-family HTH domain
VTELDDRAHLLGEFIREQRRVARLSLRKLSDMAQISNPYLSQIERGLRKPSAEILQQLAKALRISAETLYVQAGILDERTDATDLERAIWDETTISEAQKKALIQVFRSFQHENLASAAEEPGAPEAPLSAARSGPRNPAKRSATSRATPVREERA